MNMQQALGWSQFFHSQCTESELKKYQPARIFSMQKESVLLKTEVGEFWIPLSGTMRSADPFVVGDWFLFDSHQQKIIRRLKRKSLFKRITSAKHLYIQLIGANIDTLFIVTSCNDDFNLSRLERYLTFVHDAQTQAVIIITKSDLCADTTPYIKALKELGDIDYIFADALSEHSLQNLKKWCGLGQTIALMGSSGVGKSTIVNTLMGGDVQMTGAIRDDDSKGRHTTTHRSIHILKNGGLLLDSPGIRELQTLANQDAVHTTFDDIITLAQNCEFRDCQHDKEQGCAVKDAINNQKISQRRFDNYKKLSFESERANQMLSKRLKSERQTSKYRQSNKVKYKQLK